MEEGGCFLEEDQIGGRHTREISCLRSVHCITACFLSLQPSPQMREVPVEHQKHVRIRYLNGLSEMHISKPAYILITVYTASLKLKYCQKVLWTHVKQYNAMSNRTNTVTDK